jgi:fermentation-respiration switch protein FrsA (DUF1100 family)
MNLLRWLLRTTMPLAAGAIVGVVLLLLVRTPVTNYSLFRATKGQSRTPQELEMPFEERWVTAKDGVKTQGWWIPSKEKSPVVLMFHGNAGTMSDRLDFAKWVWGLGASLYMAEYRGYGDSEGSPSEQGLYADADACLEEVRKLAAGAPVVVFGRSIGGAVAIDLASRHPVDGLIVESTFTSLREMAGRSSIPFASHLAAYDFDSVSKIGEIEVPILIVHGNKDSFIPFSMGEALRDAAKSPVFHKVTGGEHNDTYVLAIKSSKEYTNKWRTLLDRL